MAEFWRSTTVPHLEARRSCQENSCYRPHSHDTFSVGLIEAGTSVLSGRLDGTVRLEPGDVVLIPAGQVHACNPDDGAWRYQMIHMDQTWTASLEPDGEASDLFTGVRVLRHPFVRDQASALGHSVFADEPPDRIEARFADLCRAVERAPAMQIVHSEADPELLARLRPAITRLRDDETNPALADLAALVGMSTYQFGRAMRRATGLAPLAWRQNARIIRARQLLREGRPIAETAHTLGFADQSHFHRVFRSHVAASPGTYRG